MCKRFGTMDKVWCGYKNTENLERLGDRKLQQIVRKLLIKQGWLLLNILLINKLVKVNTFL